jgi:hypothetical protein
MGVCCGWGAGHVAVKTNIDEVFESCGSGSVEGALCMSVMLARKYRLPVVHSLPAWRETPEVSLVTRRLLSSPAPHSLAVVPSMTRHL